MSIPSEGETADRGFSSLHSRFMLPVFSAIFQDTFTSMGSMSCRVVTEAILSKYDANTENLSI